VGNSGSLASGGTRIQGGGIPPSPPTGAARKGGEALTSPPLPSPPTVRRREMGQAWSARHVNKKSFLLPVRLYHACLFPPSFRGLERAFIETPSPLSPFPSQILGSD
jgi:hypothetical protein